MVVSPLPEPAFQGGRRLPKVSEDPRTAGPRTPRPNRLPEQSGAIYQSLALTYGQLGQSAQTEETHQKLLQILESPPMAWPDVPKYQHELANAYHILAWYYQTAHKMNKAEQFYDKSLLIRQRLVEKYPRIVEYLRCLGQIQHERGMLWATRNQFSKSVTAYQ